MASDASDGIVHPLICRIVQHSEPCGKPSWQPCVLAVTAVRVKGSIEFERFCSRWCSAKRGRRDTLDRLLDVYEVDEKTRSRIQQLRADSHKTGWWTLHSLPEWFTPYVGFEADAVEAFNFETTFVPGLLQTRDYARVVHETTRTPLDPDTVEDQVEARIRRQSRLSQKDPLILQAVVAEEALIRPMGTDSIMVEQLQYLLDLSNRGNIHLRVLPISAGGSGVMQWGFMVLRFNDHADIAFVDTPLSGSVIDAPQQTAELARTFSHLQSFSLSDTDSRSALTTLAAKYEQA